MEWFQTRLFLRIISKSREVYGLKIITLAIAFSCSTLILLFALNEFGYDRFHQDYHSIFRLLQRNNNESYSGNRLSNKIPVDVCSSLKSDLADSMILSRVKVMKALNVRVEGKIFRDCKFYAADPEIAHILSFDILHGSLKDFQKSDRSIILSLSTAVKYFGTSNAIGKKLKIGALRDTLLFTVGAIYKDYPQNSHETFDSFIKFDSSSIKSLNFDPAIAGVYGRMQHGDLNREKMLFGESLPSNQLTYYFQPVSEIYFGPRVLGDEAKHGDLYSILILICITSLILFLALTGFINLTTLSLPYRSKELAVKKLAGTNHFNLMLAFARESTFVVGASLALGIMILVVISDWIEPILSIHLGSLLLKPNSGLILIWVALFLIIAISPLFMVTRFVRATPNQLLGPNAISFPRFKRTIIFLQLGLSIFLIVASMVLRRQVTYSLLKEPGRNYEQIVYMSYPKDLTDEGLRNLRVNWKKYHANIIDVLGTSQLPNQISSKELNSPFYFIGVDPAFRDFFDLQIVEGNWFKANAGDSITVVNEQAKKLLGKRDQNVIGVFKDLSEQFNQPEKPIKIKISSYHNYNFLCIRILEVDIRRTIDFLEAHFERAGQKPVISFLNKRFEEWLRYQDRLNILSEMLAIISALLSCCAIYGLSISIVRDKLKQIAVHKLCGANTVNITRLLVHEFTTQMIKAILIFGPLTYIILKEFLRSFVYSTPFNWLDPIIPLAYCVTIVILLCGFQALSLNRKDLSAALKG